MMDALQQIGNWLAAGHSNLAYSLIGAGTALIGLALFIRLAARRRFPGDEVVEDEAQVERLNTSADESRSTESQARHDKPG
jgi:hypothetical protein